MNTPQHPLAAGHSSIFLLPNQGHIEACLITLRCCSAYRTQLPVPQKIHNTTFDSKLIPRSRKKFTLFNNRSRSELPVDLTSLLQAPLLPLEEERLLQSAIRDFGIFRNSVRADPCTNKPRSASLAFFPPPFTTLLIFKPKQSCDRGRQQSAPKSKYSWNIHDF